jgi:hypothetical protein
VEIKIRRGDSPAARERWGKRFRSSRADLGVAGIIEGKLGGGGSTRYRADAARFRGRRWCSDDWSAGRQRNLVRGLRCGDVMLMVLLAEKEKGWNFGSTRNRTAAESEIAGAMFWAARAQKEEEERIRKGQ